MRTRRTVALLAVAVMAFAAACSGGAAPAASVGADAHPAPAPVVPAGPVRRLLRRAREGLLPRRRLRRHDHPGRRRDRARDGRRRRAGGVRHQLGAAHARPARVRRRRRRHRPGLPALADPAGLVQGQEHHQARGPRRARRSARGASATRRSCTRACARPASTPTIPRTSRSPRSSSTWRPSPPARSTPRRR